MLGAQQLHWGTDPHHFPWLKVPAQGCQVPGLSKIQANENAWTNFWDVEWSTGFLNVCGGLNLYIRVASRRVPPAPQFQIYIYIYTYISIYIYI